MYIYVKLYQSQKSKVMPFPFCSSLVLETKMSQSFFYNKSPVSLLVVKPTGEKTLLYQNLASISTNIKPLKISLDPRFSVFVFVTFCQPLHPNKALAYFFILFLSWDENIYFRFPHTSFYGGKFLAWLSNMVRSDSEIHVELWIILIWGKHFAEIDFQISIW